MSWDAHVSAGIQSSPKVKSAVLFGPDGAVWGKHGSAGVDHPKDANTSSFVNKAYLESKVGDQDKISATHKASECKSVDKCVKDGQAIKLEGKKYFYINNIDGYGMFRGGATSVAGYQSSGHGALIFGCDGVSGPECITLATQLREYLKTVGVN